MSNDSFDFVGFIAWFENLIDYIIAIISGKKALDFDNLENDLKLEDLEIE